MAPQLKEHPTIYDLVFRSFDSFYEKRIIAKGTENIPDKGPAIIMSNHVRKIDPVMFNSAIKKHLFYMAKEDIIHDEFPSNLLNPTVTYFLHFINSYPANRINMKTKQFSVFYEIIKENKHLIVFPTGGRSLSGKIRGWYEKETFRKKVKKGPEDIAKLIRGLYVNGLKRKDEKTKKKIENLKIIPAGIIYDIITKDIFINLGEPKKINLRYLNKLKSVERKEAMKDEGEKIISGIESLVNVNLDSLCAGFLCESVRKIVNQELDNCIGRYKLDEGSFTEGVYLIVNKVLKLKEIYTDTNLKDGSYISNYVEEFFTWLNKEKFMEFNKSSKKVNVEKVLESPFKKKNPRHLANRISHFKKISEIIKEEVRERDSMVTYVS